jgi:hypothetical protein
MKEKRLSIKKYKQRNSGYDRKEGKLKGTKCEVISQSSKKEAYCFGYLPYIMSFEFSTSEYEA